MSNPPPLTIDASYLRTVQTELQNLLTDVEGQIEGNGTIVVRGNTLNIPAVDDTLTLSPGAPSFDLGKTLTSKLDTMGGSVSDVLVWLKRVLTDMISEITTTITTFSTTETINSQTVTQLMNEFAGTIQDINSPPSSSSSSSSSGS